MKKTSTLLFLLLGFPWLFAHEFWLSPEKFRLQKGESINVDFLVGEHFEGEKWHGNRGSVTMFQQFSKDGKTDLTPSVSTDSGKGISARFDTEGTHLLAYNSKNKFIELEANKFTEYLKEDGLQNALEWREKNGKTGEKGREYYQRCVKTLIQVGDKLDNTFKQNTQMPLEIIAQQNPYALKMGDSLEVKVLFKNKNLPDALVRVWNRHEGKMTETPYKTDSNGRVKFLIANDGKYMVSLVKMEKNSLDTKADWQSYWGSLTFGLSK